MNVERKEYTGKGQGNFNSVGAAAGIASFLGLDAGNIVGARCGRHGGGGGGSEEVAALQAQIAELKAERYSDAAAREQADRLLQNYLKPYGDRIALQMANEARMEEQIKGINEKMELKEQIWNGKLDLAKQEAKCCCDKTNMRVDCLEEKVDGITKTVIPATAIEKSV